ARRCARIIGPTAPARSSPLPSPKARLFRIPPMATANPRTPARIPVRALIVDDEKAIRRFVRSVLVAEDFPVEEAHNLASARSALAAHKPDIVILDLDLPDGDGGELIAPLTAADGPAILVLSAYDEETRKVAALDAGAHDFVTKPFGVQEFMA